MPPQSDPWIEAAKNYKPQSGGEAAPSGGNDDWKMWQQGGSAEPTEENGIQRAFDKLTTVTPEQEKVPSWMNPTVGKVINRVQEFGAGAIQGAGQPFVHPLQTIEGIGHTIAHPIDTAESVYEGAKENPAQTAGNLVGGAVLGGAADEAGSPLLAKIPTRAKAGALFQETMGKAGKLPVDLNSSSEPLTRAFEMGERGMTRPKVVNQLMRRVTAPDSEPMTYQEARDYAQSLSRQSSSEGQKLTPAMKAQVGKLSHAFNEDVGRTAEGAGVGPQYQQAMEGYRRAMQLRHALINGAKVGGGALATGYLAHRLLPAVLPDR